MFGMFLKINGWNAEVGFLSERLAILHLALASSVREAHLVQEPSAIKGNALPEQARTRKLVVSESA